MEKKINPFQIIRKKEVLAILQISSPTLWRWVNAGIFPKALRLGSNSCGWLLSEVENWVTARAAARSGAGK